VRLTRGMASTREDRPARYGPGVPPLPGPAPNLWNELALRGRNVFATHTWASTWWEHYGDGATPQVLCDDPLAPRVVLPLCTRGRLLRQVRWIGHGPADLLGPACAPEDLPLAAPLLRAALDDGRLAADVVLLQDCPTAAPWWAGLPVRPIGTEVSPVLRFEAGQEWDGWLAGKSKNFRAQATKKRSRLERDHEVRFRLATAATLEQDLADLFTLHAARWKGDSPLLDPRQHAFTAAFATAALERGWLRLWSMEVDGRCVSVLLGFRFGPDFYCYQFGRDPELDRESVGFVLLTHAVRDALETGGEEFRFLRGDEDYKQRFATGDAGIGTLALPRGVRGRGAVAFAVRRRRRHEE
jgi:CelD/BcsL family acetyltransferase involved in cellulose biosynthesis